MAAAAGSSVRKSMAGKRDKQRGGSIMRIERCLSEGDARGSLRMERVRRRALARVNLRRWRRV